MKMNNGPTPRWQRMRRLGATFFFAYFNRRNNVEDQPHDGSDPPIRAHRLYDHRLRKLRNACTYEDRLLNLIQHEADKMDRSKEANSNATTNNDQN